MHKDGARNGQTVEDWATAANLGIKGFEHRLREEFYGQVYARRLEGTHDTGHAELQSLLSGKEPSFGYSILAYILANTPHKAVVTTNFDNLVADALYLYSNTARILCVHESLAAFITTQLERPLVVKIHRDLLFSPRNADDEIDILDIAWDAPLRTLLTTATPIFIGYGGNDGSLMGFLEKLTPPVPDRIYWCVRRGSPPNARVKALLDQRGGSLVIIPGFDELMFALKDALEIPDLLPDLDDRHRRQVERYTQQRSSLSKALDIEASRPGATPEQKTLGEVVTAANQQLEKDDTPDSWILRAKAEPDKVKAEATYRHALIKHPDNGALKAAFGTFLAEERQAFTEAEELIKSAWEAAPEDPDRQHDYGRFLWKHRREGRQSEQLLRSAVAKRTVSLGPEHPSVLMSRHNLATALRAQGKDAEAEQEHRAVFAIRERVLGAEHPQTLTSRMNLATALRDQGKNAEAEGEYRTVLATRERVLGAEHPDVFQSCYNLALCLEDQHKLPEALAFIQRAETGWQKTLGWDHPNSKQTEQIRECIEAALALEKAKGGKGKKGGK